MTKAERKENLLPNGKPRWVRCYDNGGETIDRYTVIYTNAGRWGGEALRGSCQGIGMSEHPFHPQGFGQHFEHENMIDRPSYKHLGRKITFDQLPPDCQRCVLQDYREIWSLQ